MSLTDKSADVTFDPQTASTDDLVKAVQGAGFKATVTGVTKVESD